MQWKLIKALNLSGPDDRRFKKIWNNVYLREWCLYNIFQDEDEEYNKLKLLLTAINPKIIEYLEKPVSTDNILSKAHKPSDRKTKDTQDKAVLESIQRYKEKQLRLSVEDYCSLNDEDEGVIDAGCETKNN